MTARVVVTQRGAREHYMAAEALKREGVLAALVTDWYAPSSAAAQALLGLCGSPGRRMLAARSEALSHRDVIAFRAPTLLRRLSARFRPRARDVYAEYLATDRAFGARLARTKLPPHEVLFAYSYAACEALEAARRDGRVTILDQIDPGPVEFRRVAEEAAAWPQYVLEQAAYPTEYFSRLREEWRLADGIVVNSRWSRDALVAEGVPADRIDVLPLAYDTARVRPAAESRRPGGRLRVLWLGQVNLRKGIPYLVEAAKLLCDEPVDFMVVGHAQITADAMASAPRNIHWSGPVPRDRVGELYSSADVFVLPTVSDGFAITQLEAMAHGVPVVTTPNCGEVVEDGRNGDIVPARDARALAEAIQKFVRDPARAARMRAACVARAAAFSPEAYRLRLVEIIGRRAASARLSSRAAA